MEQLVKEANAIGLDQEESELVVGGFVWVLKKSKNVEKQQFQALLEQLNGLDAALKQYEAVSMRQKLPNPAMMLLPRPDFAPPGPPPPILIKAAFTSVKKATRNDKDAGHTNDVVELLTKTKGIDKDKILAFLPVFCNLVQANTDVTHQVNDVVRMPAMDAKEEQTKEQAINNEDKQQEIMDNDVGEEA